MALRECLCMFLYFAEGVSNKYLYTIEAYRAVHSVNKDELCYATTK